MKHADNEREVLVLEDVMRTYAQGETRVDVFRDLTLRIFPGEMVALVGHSGAGKSSLLQIAGLLEAPTAGRIIIDGHDCTQLDDKKRTGIRRHDIGFVYQAHNLLPEFSARENVELPRLIAGHNRVEARRRADHLLESFGLGDRLHHRPPELSGGEQQRVAIARALANNPRLVLADEPTGNLDPHTARAVFTRLLEVTRSEGAAALVATHNLELALQMDRVIRVHDGGIREGKNFATDYHSL